MAVVGIMSHSPCHPFQRFHLAHCFHLAHPAAGGEHLEIFCCFFQNVAQFHNFTISQFTPPERNPARKTPIIKSGPWLHLSASPWYGLWWSTSMSAKVPSSFFFSSWSDSLLTSFLTSSIQSGQARFGKVWFGLVWFDKVWLTMIVTKKVTMFIFLDLATKKTIFRLADLYL